MVRQLRGFGDLIRLGRLIRELRSSRTVRRSLQRSRSLFPQLEKSPRLLLSGEQFPISFPLEEARQTLGSNRKKGKQTLLNELVFFSSVTTPVFDAQMGLLRALEITETSR